MFKYSTLDLEKAIDKSVDKFQPSQAKALTYNLLCALKFLHSANILHRDLKPANILVNTSFQVKICDFGLSRSKKSKGTSATKVERPMSPCCFTRFYRPPEVILEQKDYDERADIWSLGCILAEVYQRTVSDKTTPMFLSDSCFPLSPFFDDDSQNEINLSSNDLLIKIVSVLDTKQREGDFINNQYYKGYFKKVLKNK